MKWISACVLLFVMAFVSVAAPAPFPRKKKEVPFTIVGNWDCNWGSTKCVVRLMPGGGYYNEWSNNDPWTGSYLIKEEKDKDGKVTVTLEISEWRVNDFNGPLNPLKQNIVVELGKDGKLKGKINGSQDFDLERIEEKKGKK